MMIPQIQYTKSGDINIAYQVFGTGPIDLVYIPGWISNIDWMWACPELVDFFKELGKVARVVLFDKRGTGLSDRVVELSTLEERMEDIKAVMDAINSEKAILFGHSEGGSVSAMFSATYPNRVIALIAFGIFAKRRYSPEYPWAPTDEERQKVYDMIENNWGSGKMNLETLVPSKANDERFMNWLASYFRSGASPQAAMRLTQMNTQVDIIDILGCIKVPTLLMQRTHDIDVKIEEGRFIAQHIKGAKFVEFDGADHLFWAGNTEEILDEMKRFIKDLKPNTERKKGMLTVLFGQVATTSNSNLKPNEIASYIEQCQGTIINLSRKSFMAIFEVPGKAVKCGVGLQERHQEAHVPVSMGVYLKEGFKEAGQETDERDDYMMRTILAQARPFQIFATQTVKHLLSGAAFNFAEETSILSYASGTICRLYGVSAKSNPEEVKNVALSYGFSRYDSFLQDVLEAIHDHLDCCSFGVDVLTSKIGVSERKLQRKTKESTGKSPGQLINFVRLQKAKEALASRKLTIAEVAFQYGFSSPSYFSKCFRKEFGVSPTEAFSTV
ncbi:alpha/beta fold hydrolase [Sungkyunkwania multivorans]|uniref:Alpha/beta fold hydrolase n=1 Tax=Sungkyunkwania multivorans TaxID=1173618 RepID=A0ABW3CXH9_9FLAO